MKTIELPLPKERSRNHAAETADSSVSKSQRYIHFVLCVTLFTLITEGIARKLAPRSAGTAIFFMKDFLTATLLIMCLRSVKNAEASGLLKIMGILLFLLFPCIVLTAVEDPVLAAFGIKEYALYPTIALAMCLAYIPNNLGGLYSLFRFVALSVLVTTGVAVAQNKLPASSFLNLSANGDDLSAFSAGGYVRVSATFTFNAQYCFYLNALCYCLPAFFYLTKVYRGRAPTLRMVALMALFIIGTFVTGARSSVIGNGGILCAAGAFCVIFGGAKAAFKLGAFAAVGMVLLTVIEEQYPEYFAAYTTRVETTTEVSHKVEVEQRIIDGLFRWTAGTVVAPPTLLGYGLGVMSNGSEKLSRYAYRWRGNGFWTETDQASTLFEGGWYLIFVWYGFRFYMMFYGLSRVLQIRDLDFRLPACFALGYIIVIGVTGTLAIQPPLAIWWWLGVGLIICLAQLDRERQAQMADTAFPA